MQSKAMVHQIISNKNDPKTEHAQNKIVIDQFVLQKMIRKCNPQMYVSRRARTKQHID